MLVCTCLNFTGCGKNSSKLVAFRVNMNDKIPVRLNTEDGFEISSDLPFVVSQDGKALSTGSFLPKNAFEQYRDNAFNNPNCKILQQGSTEDGNMYCMWSCNEKEFHYIISIDGMDYSLHLENTVSRDSAEDCFSHLRVGPNA